MRRTRYQEGTVHLDKRHGMWRFRWWDRSSGKAVRHSINIGTLRQLPTKAKALRVAMVQRGKINAEVAPNALVVTLQMVAEMYMAEDMPQRFSTRKGYLAKLQNHILPRWGETCLAGIQAADVERWLAGLPYAPKTKVHIRNLLRILIDSAMRRGLIQLGRNPIELVRIRDATRRKRGRVLSSVELQLLLSKIDQEPLRTLVTLAMCTGMRASELFALKWSDIDWEGQTVSVQRSIVDGRVDQAKTAHSAALIPLDGALADVLLEWRGQTGFRHSNDWVFASPFSGGTLPYLARGLQQRMLAPLACSLGLGQIGWHTFRHTYRALLGSTNAPMDVQRDLMRHASIVTTIDTYGDTMPSTLRSVNSEVVRKILIGPQMDRAPA